MWRLTRLPLRPIAALALPCAAVGYSQNEATVCSDHNDPIHDMLEHLYGDLADGDEIPVHDAQRIDDSGGHVAYGELTTRGLRDLGKKYLQPQTDDVFADLGSGRGRAVLQCALEWPCRKAVGIELSDTRHGIAQRALERCPPAVRARATLVHGDLLDLEECEDATIIYVASLLFDDPFMARLGQRLTEALPRLRMVTSLTRFPPDALPGFTERMSNFAADVDPDVLAERVEVTWGAARVFVYERDLSPS